MIRYSLVCAAEHGFESWFPSSDSYDAQVERGFVACPICGTTAVSKALMAPALGRADRGLAPSVPATADSAEASAETSVSEAPVTMVAEPERRMRAMLRAVREHLTANSEAVGTRFPEEARRIHYGEAEGRSIHGQASPEEARALIDEGIAVAPLPIMPDDRN